MAVRGAGVGLFLALPLFAANLLIQNITYASVSYTPPRFLQHRGGVIRCNSLVLSYRLCYLPDVAQREKRSVSISPDLARAIDRAAAQEGTTFSAWLSDTAAHRLRLAGGRRAIAEWEREHGPLTPEELADGLARARALLGRGPRALRRSA